MDKIIHLSLTRKSVPTRIDVVQYATRPNIVFVIDDYSIPEGSTVSLYIKKPDDTEIFNYCEFEDNQVTYTPTTQSFAVLGTSKCQLQIVESDGTAVSFLIYADVTENIIDSSAIESQDEFTALEEALQTVSDYDGRITQNTNRLDNLGDEHVTFEEATTDTTISDNLTLSTIFGRIKHLFTRTKTLEDAKVERVSPATAATVDCFPNGNPPQRVRLSVTDNNGNLYRGIFTDKSLGLWNDTAGATVWSMRARESVTITRNESYIGSDFGYNAFAESGFIFVSVWFKVSANIPNGTSILTLNVPMGRGYYQVFGADATNTHLQVRTNANSTTIDVNNTNFTQSSAYRYLTAVIPRA